MTDTTTDTTTARIARLVDGMRDAAPDRVVTHLNAQVHASLIGKLTIGPRADEFTESAEVNERGAVVTYRRKYGRTPGVRVQTFKRDTELRYHLKREFDVIDPPATTANEGPRRVVLAEMPARPAILEYQVRSVHDNRVMATCRLEADAQLILDSVGRDKVKIVPITRRPALGHDND
jgi:hypothetical protein